MNKISYSVAVFVGLVKPIRHASPLSDSEFIQLEAKVQEKSLSSIYSKWVELPDCESFTLANGSWDLTKGEIIQLADDLTNASIANCKGSTKPWAPPPPANYWGWNSTLYGGGYEEPVPRSVIFDPVWKTSEPMEDSQHQVNTANMPTGVTQSSGPRGDFYMKWKYKDGSNQPFQDALKDGGQNTKVVPWNEAGPAGKDYKTYDWTTGYNGNATYYSGLANPPTNY